MSVFVDGSKLVERLIADGIIPVNCLKFTLTIDVHEGARIRAEAFVDDKTFERIVEALSDSKSKVREIVQTVVLRRESDPSSSLEIEP